MAVARTRSTAEATAEGLRVFIAGVPWHVTEDVLKRDFGECGVIEDIFLIKDAEGNSKGRCFITFRDNDAVDAALEYNNTDYGGRKIYVKIAEAKRNDLSRSAADKPPVGTKPVGCVSLCLKKIRDASEEDIGNFLEGCSVQAIRLLTDRETGARRGAAFVDFSTTEDVDKAMKLNGKKLYGGPVDMEFVIPKSETSKHDKAAVFPNAKPDGCTSLCLKNLGDAVEDEIWKFLDGCDVQSVRLVYDRVSGASRGIAFVDFSSPEDVDKAMLRNGKTVKGNAVEMRYEAPKERPRPEGCLTVAVKKLPAGTLEPDVRKLFKGLNSISDVRVICDKMMACTGLAFVEFTTPEDVEAAVKRDGMSVLGQTVFICYETKQKKVRDSQGIAFDQEPTARKRIRKTWIAEESRADESGAAPVEDDGEKATQVKKKKRKQVMDEDGGMQLATEAGHPTKKFKRKASEKRQLAEKERKKKRKVKKRSTVAQEETDVTEPAEDCATKIKKTKKRKSCTE